MRHLINPKQSNRSRVYFNQNNMAVNVGHNGVYFSDDKEMDDTVEYFKKVLGFVKVKDSEKLSKEIAKKSEKEAKENIEKKKKFDEELQNRKDKAKFKSDTENMKTGGKK